MSNVGDNNAAEAIGKIPRCDVLLFIAVPSEEKAIRNAAKSAGTEITPRQGAYFEYLDMGSVGSNKVMAVRTEMGPLSHTGSAARAIFALSETKATTLVSLGMAFGVDRKTQKLGDVLISRMLLPYDYRIVRTVEGRMHVDYSEVKSHPAKLSLLRAFEAEAQKVEWEGRTHFGALLTGAARIHCTEFRDELVKNLSTEGEPVIGGEMEGGGLLSTCDPADPSWIVVKGISDFADEQRSVEVKEGRPLACANSVRFVLQALRGLARVTYRGIYSFVL